MILQTLEITFHSKIATVDNVKGYCTNPKEVVVRYETYAQPESWCKAIMLLRTVAGLLNVACIPSNRDFNQSSREFKRKSVNVKLLNLIEDIKEHADITGNHN